MNLKKFLEKCPFLYHLTSKNNTNHILKDWKLYSANYFFQLTSDQEILKFQRNRRPQHLHLLINDSTIDIRDQRPISMVALKKCLTNNWTGEDFLYYLNDRVFFWSNLKRLAIHYKRYQCEKPTLLRFSTSELFELNNNPLFTNINTGATRCNPYLGGKPHMRGENTFQNSIDYNLPIHKVAEVTFLNECILPNTFWIGSKPDGTWKFITNKRTQ